jgi:hypothetical protein
MQIMVLKVTQPFMRILLAKAVATTISAENSKALRFEPSSKH